MKKIVVIDGYHYPSGAYDEVAKMCEANSITFQVLKCKTPEEVIEQAQDADVFFCIYMKIDDYLLSKLPNLKMVIRQGIGVDCLNLADFTKHGVYACNVPDYGVEEVAIHSLSLLLSLERKIPLYNKSIHSGEWNEEIGYAMHRISCRTVGLLGFGRIARKLSSILTVLNYTVIAYDPYLDKQIFEQHSVEQVDLDTLFKNSDALIVMAPATADTINIVNDENLNKAKDGLFIVNTARGALIDVESLIKALDTGKVKAAALDVLTEEPPKTICKQLLGRDNVILTPHIAYRTVESSEALKRMMGEIALAFLNEGKVTNVVNKDVIGKKHNS